METFEKVTIEYCDLCSFPKEFCEFSPTPEECKLKNEAEKPSKTEKKEETTSKAKETKKIINIDVVQVKNRVITKIQGLDKFEIDIKKISKKLSKTIGCGCSKGKEGLELQGPNADQVMEVLIKEMKGLLTFENFEITENIKKKKKRKKRPKK